MSIIIRLAITRSIAIELAIIIPMVFIVGWIKQELLLSQYQFP